MWDVIGKFIELIPKSLNSVKRSWGQQFILIVAIGMIYLGIKDSSANSAYYVLVAFVSIILLFIYTVSKNAVD